jgi:hypothetical protein
MVPAYGRLLAIGRGAEAIAPHLPAGCTLACAAELPAETDADLVLLLDPASAPSQAVAAARLERPLICVSPMAEADAFGVAMREVGLRPQCAAEVSPELRLFKWVRGGDTVACAPKRVLVLSYFHIPNFGDRLGYHVLNSLLPADVEVVHAPLAPFTVPEGAYDLLILGIGNSLLPRDACSPELAHWLEHIPRAIGIFGTQYRDQYREPAVARGLAALLDRLTTWWARYEEDIFAFGRGRANVRHLGDWLIAASPMANPRVERNLAVPPDILMREAPLDRTIQRIQAYRSVESARLHPLLCALTSAAQAAYREQRSGALNAIEGTDPDPQAESGKFRSLLYDVFGRTFDEGEFFAVDRQAVAAYRRKVLANMEALRAELYALLERQLPDSCSPIPLR